MSIEKVREYLTPLGIADRIREFEVSSATVELAALAVGVEGARIAKTLSFKVNEEPILVVAAGKPKLITAEYVKEGAVVIDIGMHRDENNKLCGDVDFESVKDKVSSISPVPGGVGPMTRAMLLSNCVKAAKN